MQLLKQTKSTIVLRIFENYQESLSTNCNLEKVKSVRTLGATESPFLSETFEL